MFGVMGIGIRGSGLRVRELGRELWFILMGVGMKGSGKMTSLMGKVS